MADGAEHDLGLGMRRDHVGRDAAADQADRVMCRAEQRVGRPSRIAQCPRRIEQLLDRRLAELRIPGVRRAAVGDEPAREHAARGGAEAIVGRLAVDQELRRRGNLIGRERAVAAPLFAGHEHQPDARLARRAQAARPPPLARRECPSRRRRRARRDRSPSMRLGKNGGTQSKWVENTSAARRRRRSRCAPVRERLLEHRVAAPAQVRRRAPRPTSPSRPVVESMSMS